MCCLPRVFVTKGCLLRGHEGRYIEGTIRSGWGSTLIRNCGVWGEMRGAEGVGVEQGAPGVVRTGRLELECPAKGKGHLGRVRI